MLIGTPEGRYRTAALDIVLVAHIGTVTVKRGRSPKKAKHGTVLKGIFINLYRKGTIPIPIDLRRYRR